MSLLPNVLIAQLPAESDRFQVFNDENPYISYFIGVETYRYHLPKGKSYEILALHYKMNEQLAKQVVPNITNEDYPFDELYPDYKSDGVPTNNDGVISQIIGYNNALDSFKSFFAMVFGYPMKHYNFLVLKTND